jgi:hypothetical protein
MPTLSRLKITAAQLRASAAAKPTSPRPDSPEPYPARRTTLIVHATERAVTPRRIADHNRAPPVCSRCSLPEQGAAGARMIPEPSRTSVKEHHRMALTCGISKTRRSAHDRNNLDTVEVTGSIPVSPTTYPQVRPRVWPGDLSFWRSWVRDREQIGSRLLHGAPDTTHTRVVVNREQCSRSGVYCSRTRRGGLTWTFVGSSMPPCDTR